MAEFILDALYNACIFKLRRMADRKDSRDAWDVVIRYMEWFRNTFPKSV